MNRDEADQQQEHDIRVHLDALLTARNMTLAELADQVGVTVVNLSILKNGRARAIRFNTLTGICRALNCQPGDILTVGSNDAEAEEAS